MRIDPNDIATSWDHTFMLDGVEVPLLKPSNVEGDGRGGKAPRGLRHVPGALRRLAAKIWSGTDPIDVLRASCKQIVPVDYHSHIDRAPSSELTTMITVYAGLNRAYYAAMLNDVQTEALEAHTGQTIERVGQIVDERMKPKAPASPRPKPQNPRTRSFPIIPGQPLPGTLGGKPWGRLCMDEKPEATPTE